MARAGLAMVRLIDCVCGCKPGYKPVQARSGVVGERELEAMRSCNGLGLGPSLYSAHHNLAHSSLSSSFWCAVLLRLACHATLSLLTCFLARLPRSGPVASLLSRSRFFPAERCSP